MKKKQTEYLNDNAILLIPFTILWIQIVHLLVMPWSG